MKPVIFENPRTRERVICDDVHNISVIEGEEYLTVHRVNEQRVFLIRRTAVVPVTISALVDKLVKSALSKGVVLSVRI